MRPCITALLTVGMLVGCSRVDLQVVWWEAEDATDTNLLEHSWLEMDAKAREGLSGGDWLTLMHKVDSPTPAEGRYFARYEVRVPEASRYHLWSREWPRSIALPNRWRFDDQPWQEAVAEVPQEDRVNLASNRAAGWSRYGAVALEAGQHIFELEIEPREGNATFDCFLLCRGKFEPAGKQQPATDDPAFYEYPEDQKVEAIVQRARDVAAEKQRRTEEVAASKVRPTDFTQVGREVDLVRFGAEFLDEFEQHDGEAKWRTEDMPPRHVTLGQGQFVEWAFTAPEAGDYVVTAHVSIARIDGERTAELQVQLAGEWQDYGTLATPGQYHCLVSLPAGETRFRIDKPEGGLFYVAGARLSTVREDPWTGAEPGEHPRLQFSADEAAATNAAVSADPEHPVRYYYDGLVAAAEAQTGSPSRLNGPRASAQALNEVAIAFALTGKGEYGDRGADYLSRLSQRDFGRNANTVLGNGEYLDCMAWGYDALYPHLTDAQQKAVRERLDLEAQWMWVAARTLCKDTIHGWWASDHSNNWQAVAAGGLGMAALALQGENSYADLWLEEAIAQVKMLMDGGFDSDGAYFESPMYHKYAMEYLTTFASALRRAGGENLFEYRDQLLRKSCIYNLYMMEPTRDHSAPFNDGRRLAGDPPEALHPAGAYFARIASAHQDGLIRWLYDSMYGPGRRFPVWNFQHGHPDSVVWYDDGIPLEDPDTSPRLALARHWPEHGRVALRTGWGDPNGILFALECGEYGSHGHADQGGFILTAYGEHLVDDTGYGGWEAESEAHSVVLIDGQGQRKNGMLGEVRDFIHTPALDYFEADSTEAYAPADLVTRHVIFMRPGYFVLADQVRKDGEPHEVQWLLHSKVEKPAHEILVQVPDTVTFLAENAALEVRLLSPEAVRSEAVEKNGYRFLRVTPEADAPEARFLALLCPTSAANPMPDISPIRAEGLVGCQVGDDVVLWATGAGEWQHGALRTDAALFAQRKTPASVLAKSATAVDGAPFGFSAGRPVTAVLTATEARVVTSQPTDMQFAKTYLAGAAVYETDQDRDRTNDRRVAQVDADGKVALLEGAFTVRAD